MTGKQTQPWLTKRLFNLHLKLIDNYS